MKVYYDDDVTTNVLKDKTIAVIGYGSQGHGQSLNMKDSGLNIVMGLREGGKSWNKAKEAGESLGGVIECASVNVPAGVGAPIFDGLKNNIAQLIFGIPGVTGLEFGIGFRSARMVGSQNNDEFYVNDRGYVLSKTNNHGGIIGGISSGMPITLNVAVKPTVTNLDSGEEIQETCTVPSTVASVEAAVNIALLSHMIDYPNFC